jgi:hypothetical protein
VAVGSNGRTLFAAFALAVLAYARAGAQTEPPAIPITRFPGADFRGLACTPAPGPRLHETPAVHRQVLAFIDDAQHGRVDPKIAGVAMRYIVPRGGGSFFARIGPVRRLQFRGASNGCFSTDRSYRYHVVGRDAVANLWFDIDRGLVNGYGQEER